jgi:hypothetical protein
LVHVVIIRYSSLKLVSAKSLAILLVTYFLHPLDRFSVQLFLNSNVRHSGGCRGSVFMESPGTPDPGTTISRGVMKNGATPSLLVLCPTAVAPPSPIEMTILRVPRKWLQ